MTILAELPLPAIVSGTFGLLTAIVGGIAFVMKGIFKYLTERIATLEGREQTLLTGVVETVENMQASNKTTADFVVALADEQKYERRRLQEGHEKGARS